jgi:hypothetical protein
MPMPTAMTSIAIRTHQTAAYGSTGADGGAISIDGRTPDTIERGPYPEGATRNVTRWWTPLVVKCVRTVGEYVTRIDSTGTQPRDFRGPGQPPVVEHGWSDIPETEVAGQAVGRWTRDPQR